METRPRYRSVPSRVGLKTVWYLEELAVLMWQIVGQLVPSDPLPSVDTRRSSQDRGGSTMFTIFQHWQPRGTIDSNDAPMWFFLLFCWHYVIVQNNVPCWVFAECFLFWRAA